ncbi:GH36-type glycosyl hydrolase domain-containing protein [Paralcaligenes ginsengisoli]
MGHMPRILNFLESGRADSDPDPFEPPIRAELFSVERLEQHASSLAAAQTISPKIKNGHALSGRTANNARTLLKCYDAIAQAALERRSITPAAEWLLDNFRAIEDQLKTTRLELEAPSYRALPQLSDGPLRDHPRIYGVIWAFVAHTDSRFDASLLRCFLRAYQRTQPLTIAELWAIPVTLRCVMIENLRRLCVLVAGSQESRHQADKFADDLLALDHRAPQEVEGVLHDLVARRLAAAFAVQLIQRLRYQDISLHWLDEELARQGLSSDDIVQSEHASQAAANMTVRNLITSMRDMKAFDWQPFFEDISLVDACLRRNPIYSGMDFKSRDHYRHAIETLAGGSRHTELEIANAVMDKAARAALQTGDPQDRLSDPGYYLISTGRRNFEREIGFRISFGQRCLRAYTSHAATAYIGTILLASALLLALPLWISAKAGVDVAALCVLGLLGFFQASDVAILLIDKAITRLVPPRHLVRLELAKGIPPALRTFVVVPTLLTTEAGIIAQIDQLEVHYLANPKGDVHFALLSDWTDADTEHREDDGLLLDAAVRRIASLNARHGAMLDGEERFFLFHRKRLWNEAQHKWLAWERKRGKLHEFNRLLRGATDTSFLSIDGKPPHTPAGIRYVITLDSDTRLPIDAVRQLVGTAAHPLNRPRIDPVSRRVVEGYGILQPRITPTLPTASESSIFQHVFSGPCGIDPYAGAVSNVYQDLFGEGSYTGKGIYDVDGFEASLAGRIPENTILSHDLFEGIFARCGLVTDLELFEDFPSHYQVAASRSHRWIRGDWQLLPWIAGFTAIPILSRWKMIDNLRRSLSAPAMIFILLASWTLPHVPAGLWSAYVLLALAAPAIVSICHGLVPPRFGISRDSHMRAVGKDVLHGCAYMIIALALLAHRSWLALDAIGRTLFRLLVSHRLLLEWVTSAQAKLRASLSLMHFTWALRGAVFIVAAFGIIVTYINPANLGAAAPFLALWCVSPFFAQLISLPPPAAGPEPASVADTLSLRLSGRRIWRFFTTFVDEQNHSLPPDNFQEDPYPVVAHRSSPTNFGLYLLSTISARDFGWIGITEMVERLEATLGTMQTLPRFRGHFFNWYDTHSLNPLNPQYISSVDSGNLAGHLLALASACEEMTRKPVFTAMHLSGIRDSVWLLREAIRAERDDRRTLTVNPSQLREGLDDFDRWLIEEPANAADWPTRWHELGTRAGTLLDLAETFAEERGDAEHSEVLAWARTIQSDVASHLRDLPLYTPTLAAASRNDMSALTGGAAAPSTKTCAATLADRLNALAATAKRLFTDMKFGFLFDADRRLFAIGYRVGDASLDDSYYDLLASEARLASFIAIAKGDVAATHWFRLGRPMTPQGNSAVLMSWSGSMFEYLMPSLVMYTPRHSLLDETCRLVIVRQIAYGRKRHIPWGVSESAYNVRDRALTYQYADFGVPALGLKRGLAQNLVIAPYATALAAMYEAPAAIANFRHIEASGGCGIYGYYDAIDFTPARIPESQLAAPVRTYMAHHQGMSLVALGNTLFDGIMRHRFHRQSIVRAADLLLQEPIPREIGITYPRQDTIGATRAKEIIMPASRRFHSARQGIPSSHLLSNGRYTVMVTTAGSGYSTWDGLAVTRWREDPTSDAWGSYLFLRDTASGEVWSASYQPSGVEPDRYEVIFSEDRARIVRHDGTLATSLEILVSPEDNAEIRRLSITNSGTKDREIELTSYAEVVLAPMAADTAHPAFSNLFIQTEYLPEVQGLMAMRRPRSAADAPVWAAHIFAGSTHGENAGYETDRARFLGRGHPIRNPVAIMDGRPLSNTVGAVLDPILSLRTRVQVAAGATTHIVFATMVASTREEIINLADKYRDPASFERISTLAWTEGQVRLHHLGITADEAHLFQFLANRVLYSDPAMRPSGDMLKRNTLNATSLWQYSISGDLPIVLLRIDEQEDREIVRQLLRAHEYWHGKGLAVDLVILNEKKASYAQDLQTSLENLVSGSQTAPPSKQGGIFVLRADLLEEPELELLQCAARVVLAGNKQGSLEEQIVRMRRAESRPAATAPRTPSPRTHAEIAQSMPTLEFFNGLGGFAEQGREYVTVLGKDQRTPAPWVNIIANPDFGFQVSESGAGYTWSSNSQENQLTSWSNDPVSDTPSEVFYLRDNETGELWTPTALPIRLENTRYIARHGHGYSRFQHGSHGIMSELLQFVSWSDPVKISTLTLENRSSRLRKLSVTGYVEWVLGTARANSAPFVITEMDSSSGAMFAHNPWNAEFGQRIAFVDWVGRQTSWTGDRTEFIGRNGNLEQPAALATDTVLSNKTGAGMDPCSALQTSVEIAPGESIQLTFILGQAEDRQAARNLTARYRTLDTSKVLSEVTGNWDRILTTVQVETPDRATDLILNGWLLYQVLACRMWARTAFYQASGAYGFRDQLQDSMALNVTRPDLAREHILRSAARQFVEGDVQHWWHPPKGRGVRTHISDDRLWLPYVVAHYVTVTGDLAVLDETVPFLEGAAVAADQENAYYEPTVSAQSGSLFEHCVRAIDCSLATGIHGLPLMGGGDWNDGMNRVGHEGKGESVWLGWFLCSTISRFSAIASSRADQTCIERWQKHAAALQTALEKKAWDGAWYRRAYFDDGTPLGSSSDSECRIDSLAQSWSVISGAGTATRQQRAMQSVEQYLIRPGDDLVLLLTPPFDKTPLDPGYIKGYLPGVRENGGQYTHAATWCMIAYTILGDGNRAADLFKILNPINHASTRAGVHAYKVEPYVVAGDIYSASGHVRRGGWTWYTGSAGWLYRGGLESVLGFQKHGDCLTIDPCIPPDWRNFRFSYRHGTARYLITVDNPGGVAKGVLNVELDGAPLPADSQAVPLADDGKTHRVHVVMGPAPDTGAKG